MTTHLRNRWLWLGLGLLLGLLVVWLATSWYTPVWAARNTLYYHLDQGWRQLAGPSTPAGSGTLQGAITSAQGAPIEGAWVLVSEWDGTTHTARTDADGRYTIEAIPAGRYQPAATAPGYQDRLIGGFWGRVNLNADATTIANADLPVEPIQPVSPATDFLLAGPTILNCTIPFDVAATQRQIHFMSGDQPNQLAFYYTPVAALPTDRLPLLLAIYPGPADGWVCASLTLAQAGYAVLAAGPAYTFDLESDLDELERLLDLARQGRFPGSDPGRMAILGGSYSSLHVQRLLQRGQPVQAALLLGPPTDLFDMRRRLEDGSFVPPFGLDQAFRAMGLPSQDPLLYLKYSGAYHVRADFPPLAILHSRGDDIVPYQQSELLAANLDLVGAEYELHFFDQGGHYLLADKADADTQAIYDVTLEFLARTPHPRGSKE